MSEVIICPTVAGENIIASPLTYALACEALSAVNLKSVNEENSLFTSLREYIAFQSDVFPKSAM